MSRIPPVSDIKYQLRIANNWYAAIGFCATKRSKRLKNILIPSYYLPFMLSFNPLSLKRQING